AHVREVLKFPIERHSILWTWFVLLWLGVAGVPKAEVITEQFTSDPFLRSWQTFGDSGLFVWNRTNGNLVVTWDSSRPNSYFYLPLGTILNREDDFGLALDLQLADVLGGINPDKPSTFELALGFLNLVDATKTNYFRG